VCHYSIPAIEIKRATIEIKRATIEIKRATSGFVIGSEQTL
jgi:hypothetical protein